MTKKDEIWVYDNRITGTAVINAKKVLEGGTFKEGQFSFALKDDKGRVLQTVTNDAVGQRLLQRRLQQGRYLYLHHL